MVMIENIHHGQYLDRSDVIRELNETAIDHIARHLQRGVAEHMFRQGSTRSSCTGRSVRCASSTCRTGRRSRGSSAAISVLLRSRSDCGPTSSAWSCALWPFRSCCRRPDRRTAQRWRARCA